MRLTLMRTERGILEDIAAADGTSASVVIGKLVRDEQQRRERPQARQIDVGSLLAAIAAATR